MYLLAQRRVLVVGLGVSGQAACRLLRRQGAVVLGWDEAETPSLRRAAAELRGMGVEVALGAGQLPEGEIDLAVVSPGVGRGHDWLAELAMRKVPVVGELELGYQHCLCLNIAISGTNGKTTVTEMVERILTHHRLKTLAAGNLGRPVCEVVEETRALDFLTLEVSSFQLETVQFFRPVIAILLNITPDHLDRYGGMAEYIRAMARLFMNQQPFDWAIVQSEALAQLRAMNLKIPSKVITFSASNRRADLYFDRGLLTSRIEGWTGPLMDLDKCRVGGPHNAENLMAALAVGRVLRVPLDTMVEALRTYAPPAHRCEWIRTVGGVRYVNDSRATNLDALQKALLSVPSNPGEEANVWLIAGGKDKGFDYHDIGPLLSRRVKRAFLVGETREKMRAAWSLFTPCTLVDSLLEAVLQAAANAVAGDVVLLSPACSSFDQFESDQHRGETFRQAVNDLAEPT